jgi:uncharacterized membrane protein
MCAIKAIGNNVNMSQKNKSVEMVVSSTATVTSSKSEILWTSQAEGDTLTSDDLMAEYPDLKLV